MVYNDQKAINSRLNSHCARDERDQGAGMIIN